MSLYKFWLKAFLILSFHMVTTYFTGCFDLSDVYKILRGAFSIQQLFSQELEDKESTQFQELAEKIRNWVR